MVERVPWAGVWLYAVAGLCLVGLLVALVVTGVGLTKRRGPLVAFALIPLLCAAVGMLGTFLGLGNVYGAISNAGGGGSVQALAMQGLAEALSSDYFGRWAATVLLLCAVWGSALGSVFGVPEEFRWTGGAAGISVVLAMFGCAVTVGYAWSNHLALDAYVLALVVLFGGIGVGIGALRRCFEVDGQRVAAARFVSALCFIFAVDQAGRAVGADVVIRMMSETARATGPAYAQVLEAGLIEANQVSTVTWAAFVLAIAIGVFAVVAELGEVLVPWTGLDVGLTVVVMLFNLVIHAAESWRVSGMREICVLSPVEALVREHGADLPRSNVIVEGKPVSVAITRTHFGDVFTYDPHINGLARRFHWSGTDWSDVEGPFVAPDAGSPPPLFVYNQSDPIASIVDALKQSPEHKGYILLKSADIDPNLPPELVHTEITLLPVQLSEQHDLTKELWMEVGETMPEFGPIRWYGPGDGASELVVRMNKAVAQTKSPGLHVLLNPGARAYDVAVDCLAIELDVKVSGIVPSTRWCGLGAATPDSFRAEAAKGWAPPKTPNVTITPKPVAGVDVAKVNELLQREVGAFAWCGGDRGEKRPTIAAGKLVLVVSLAKSGQVANVNVDAGSPLQSSDSAGCVEQRLQNLMFPPPTLVPNASSVDMNIEVAYK